MTALILTGWLYLTAPLSHALPGTCEAAGDTIHDALALDVYRCAGQSPTWRDSSAAMLASPAAWARLWPKVAAEAQPVYLRTVWAMAGTRCSTQVSADEYVARPQRCPCWTKPVRVK